MVDSKCTVYFEDPFWVAVFERLDGCGYSVARFVFGSEPSETELHEFALKHFQTLSFSLPGPRSKLTSHEVRFKRRQREARQQTQQAGIGTRAQRALQAERERMKRDRQEESREERETRERQKFIQKLTQKKQKHRGH